MLNRRKLSKKSRFTVISSRVTLVFIALLIFGILLAQGVYAQNLPRDETLYVAVSKKVALGPKVFNIYTPGFDRSRSGLHRLDAVPFDVVGIPSSVHSVVRKKIEPVAVRRSGGLARCGRGTGGHQAACSSSDPIFRMKGPQRTRMRRPTRIDGICPSLTAS